MKEKLSTVLQRGIIVWLLVMVVETLHGTARRILLEPLLGDLVARQISVVTGSVIILAITFIFVRWLKGTEKLDFLLVGTVWVGLTLAFEIVIGRLVMNVTWEQIVSDYDLIHGGLMPLGLLVMLFAPLMTAKVTDEI